MSACVTAKPEIPAPIMAIRFTGRRYVDEVNDRPVHDQWCDGGCIWDCNNSATTTTITPTTTSTGNMRSIFGQQCIDIRFDKTLILSRFSITRARRQRARNAFVIYACMNSNNQQQPQRSLSNKKF